MSDPELTTIRSTHGYRYATIGMRLCMVGFPLLIVLVALARFGVGEAVVKPFIVLVLATVVISFFVGWIGTFFLAKKTTRYSGVSTGNLDLVRTSNFIKLYLADICNLRRW